MVALVEHARAPGEGAGHRDPRESLQLGSVQLGEERYTPEKLNGALLGYHHFRDYSRPGGAWLPGPPCRPISGAVGSGLAWQRGHQ